MRINENFKFRELLLNREVLSEKISRGQERFSENLHLNKDL